MQKIKELYSELKDINYGWIDKNKQIHTNLAKGNFKKNYRMQSLKEIKKTNHAICWEMCELERLYFKKNKIKHKVIFAILKTQKRKPCHTFLVFENNNTNLNGIVVEKITTNEGKLSMIFSFKALYNFP